MQHKNEKKQKITDRSPAAKNGLLLHLPNLCSLAHYACPFPILSPCCNSTRMCGLWRLQSGFPERSWNNTRCWPSNTPPYSPGFHLPPSVEWMLREALWKGFKKRAGGKKPKDKSGDGTLQITETSLKTKGLCRQKWQQGARVRKLCHRASCGHEMPHALRDHKKQKQKGEEEGGTKQLSSKGASSIDTSKCVGSCGWHTHTLRWGGQRSSTEPEIRTLQSEHVDHSGITTTDLNF